MKKPQESTTPRAAKTASPRKRSTAPKPASVSSPMDEIRALRQEVAELTRRLEASRSTKRPADTFPKDNLQPWLQIAATVGVTIALGKIMQALRLPAAAAVAVPMITAELNRKFF
ncbi:hypothetical protein ACRQ1B_12650 [Rhizobium panacihumi]|uniref:hypothetical protein n=1 Tax=Rhizobium panacihumi TaxID=2008450 RepID=UPI003D7A962E